MKRKILSALTVSAIGAALLVTATPPANALGECLTATDSSLVLTSGTCMTPFALNLAQAPSQVTGTIAGVRVQLYGGSGAITGVYGKQKINIRYSNLFEPSGEGKIGKKVIDIGSGIFYGKACTISRTVSTVTRNLTSPTLRVTDTREGALCAGLLAASDFLQYVK